MMAVGRRAKDDGVERVAARRRTLGDYLKTSGYVSIASFPGRNLHLSMAFN